MTAQPTNQPTNQPTRADWWREVTDPNEVILAGCPVRREATPQTGSVTTEFLWPCEKTVGLTDNYTYFVDSRWYSLKADYKIGDVITECTPDNLPADGVAIVDVVGDVGQLEGTRLGWACGGGVTWGSSLDGRFLPFTVIYVPKAGDSDD